MNMFVMGKLADMQAQLNRMEEKLDAYFRKDNLPQAPSGSNHPNGVSGAVGISGETAGQALDTPRSASNRQRSQIANRQAK